MIIWAHELIMMLLDVGAQQWHTVQMVLGVSYLLSCIGGCLDLPFFWSIV